MNVLIYTGNGTSPKGVEQTYFTLKAILGHAYDIMRVNADTLHNEPWQDHCSLIVFPSGRDLPYCNDLRGTAVQKIKQFVHGGGNYLGFCAGAYYASRCVEFQKGTSFEVVGTRELSFYPGTSRGTVFPGFVYNSEEGARSVSVFSKHQNKSMKVYYNGGGYFVGAHGMDQHVDVICTYNDPEQISEEKSPAAAVRCQVGQGTALLFGFHPEYDVNLLDIEDQEHKEELKRDLHTSVPLCRELLSQSLFAMGLNALQQNGTNDVLELSPMYLSTVSKDLLESITKKLIKAADHNSILADSSNTFMISKMSKENGIDDMMNKLQVEPAREKSDFLRVLYPQVSSNHGLQIVPRTLTPHFDLQSFFESLLKRRKQEWGGGSWYRFGDAIFYSEVNTSTQTVLDKNFKFSQCLPNGLVCLATNQIAGRGRGSNSWVSQAGALQFSFIVRHSIEYKKSPVVFIQYIIALSIVESIRTRKGYEDVPLRLKWPNDIYADLPNEGLKKVGGLLVNSSFLQDEFLLVVGCGVNLNNSHPTVSINDVITRHNPQLAKLEKEDLLAHALVKFETYYTEFCQKGMGSWFLDAYYKRWLHSDKLVTLTTHDNEKVKIVGITSDYGMLEAISVNNPKNKFTLQPDGNSFDMLKGLIIKKT